VRSRVFRRAKVVDGGFVVPGRHGLVLWVQTEGAGLTLEEQRVYLDWDWFPKRWEIVGVGDGGTGIGVSIAEPRSETVEWMHEQSTSSWERAFELEGLHSGAIRLTSASALLTAAPDRCTLEALCWTLAHRPEIRPRLASGVRVERLLLDLSHRVLGMGVGGPFGFARASVEVGTAMSQLNIQHPCLGRPIPGEPLRSFEATVQQVKQYIERNPYARDVSIGEAFIAEKLREYYYDVEPWPFGALTM
jgi:hypothetical protein